MAGKRILPVSENGLTWGSNQCKPAGSQFGIPTDETFTIIDGNRKDVLEEVHAHKIILAMKSTVFKKMFFTPLKKTGDN